MQRSTRMSAGLLALILGATCWAAPYFQENKNDNSDQQKQSDKNKNKNSDKDKNNKKKDDNSPFGSGKVNMLHSSHTGDSASAGFNGLTPNGEVESKKLKEPLNADDYNKAQQVSFLGVKNSSLKRFIQDGKLNTAPARSATAAPKKG
ncbi:MAG TPA: hypothetical protein VK699_16200 [Terriglobales bacterium]|jgi:hypothetical protein|nr:hypothetical protein [Terriglobales bacterium]